MKNWERGPIYGPTWGICDWHHPDDRRRPEPSSDPRTGRRADPAEHWTPKLTEAVRRIPAGDERAAYYESADSIRHAPGNDSEILGLVAVAERSLTARAADALWLMAEQHCPTITSGTRKALARTGGLRPVPPVVHRRQVATLAPPAAGAPAATGLLAEIAGTAVPYGEKTPIMGMFVEEFARDALNAYTVDTARPTPLLRQHLNTEWPIGHSVSWRSTSGGLDGVWALDDSDDAQRVARLARSGAMRAMSIGFVPLVSRWKFQPDHLFDPKAGPDHMDSVVRVAARLAETSVVPAGAYPGAQVTSVRAAATRQRHADITDQYPRSPAAWRIYSERLHRQQQRPRPTRPSREIVAEYRRFLQAHR